MLVFDLKAEPSATSSGVILPTSVDDDYLANIPPPVGGTNANDRLWRATRSSFGIDTATGRTVWYDSIVGERATNKSGTTAPGYTENINGLETITTAGATQFDVDTHVLDAARNTVYFLVKMGTDAGLGVVIGPKVQPATSAPLDDVMSFGFTAGQGRWLRDDGAGSLATLIIPAHDYQGETALFMLSMSPEHGKSVWVNGVEVDFDAALTASLVTLEYTLCGLGSIVGDRMFGDVEEILVLPGRDFKDAAYSGVKTRVDAILKARGGL